MAAPLASPVLSIDIRKRLGDFELQVQHEFTAGFTVVFGSSGAGKSTLLDCVAGLLKPDLGAIRFGTEAFFDGQKNISLPPQKRRVGYVFQSLALFPHLSVEGNVGYGLNSQNDADRRQKIAQALADFQIANLSTRRPAELSGGEKQRVALARSLVTQPKLLLLDEPLTGLDASLRRSILQDLRAWNATRRIPVLYVTHNRDEVDAIGERLITLENGKLAGSGFPHAVLNAPRTLALAQASDFENLLTARVLEQREADGVMRVALSGGGELEVPLSTAQIGELVVVAIHAGDVLLATELPRGLSARNILQGLVEAVETRGTLLALKVRAGAVYHVHVTPGAARSLSLQVGRQVWLVVKTHSCHLVSPL